jgi:hypothetical protein
MSDDKHAVARALYQDYLAKAGVLDRNRKFADEVAKATSHPSGQTPVEPLATMGPKGGALLCDVCRKPMILEGGATNGMDADDGWKKNPKKGWVSWMSGGMVVKIESNGTLRIYHGYPGRSGCVLKADRADEDARSAYKQKQNADDRSAKLKLLQAYFKAEVPEANNDATLSKIYKVLFTYDPGLGVNAVD